MVPYYGDYAANATVYIPINTFDSNDPAASVTVTNLVNTDVHIHKDGGTTQRNNAAGITMTVDFDSITGNHLLIIDTSDNTVADFWEAGHEYQVRIEGATVDGGTINAWVGSFSIERAGGALALIKSATYGLSALKTLLDTTGIKVASFADNAITAASINADAITNAKIADNAIAAENLAADCITNAKIADNAITSAKINDNAITAGKINSGAITSAKFAAGAIDATAIATNAIGSDELADAAASKIGTAVWATATRQLTNTQSFNLTGNITGNLSGSVGSVTGAVGSVTGAVGSVTGGVTVTTNNDKTGYSLASAPPSATAIREEMDANSTRLSGLVTELGKVPKSDSNVTWNNTALGSIQTKCGDALAAYDPPTNAEMEARTIASANYATASNLSTTDGKIDSIKTKTDSLTFTKSGEVDSNIKSINGTTVTGDGGVTPWGP